MMKDLGTDILACTPSYALLIADTAIEMGYDPAEDFKISAVILGAEPASESMRQEIREKLGVQYCDVYGLSEVMGPGVAMECAESHGLHVAEDHFYAEIVDPDTLKPLPDGEYGELVFTTLTRECCPLVRYRTRDVTRIIPEECACGRTHRKIDRIVGRTDDMLIIRGVNVFPSQIEQVIVSFPEIATQYQIVLSTRRARSTTSSCTWRRCPTSRSTRSASSRTSNAAWPPSSRATCRSPWTSRSSSRRPSSAARARRSASST